MYYLERENERECDGFDHSRRCALLWGRSVEAKSARPVVTTGVLTRGFRIDYEWIIVLIIFFLSNIITQISFDS